MLARAADVPLVAASLDVFLRFLRLGFTSFGGPVAHLGFFRREFVERARWLDEAAFAEIVALCSVLPGPTSSQVGILLGFRRAGPAGAALAWLGFTMPSAIALGAFGLWIRATSLGGASAARLPFFAGLTEGLLAAAAAVVALAVVQLGRTLTTTAVTRAIGAVAFVIAFEIQRYAPGLQWLPLLFGCICGALFAPSGSLPRGTDLLPISRRAGTIAGATFAVLLLGLPIVAVPGSALGLFALFFRAGALVFGGGHVVLPFLQGAIGPLVSERDFFAGYGAAQAVPGPLSTFAAYLGAANRSEASGVWGAALALAGIFTPSFLLVTAAVPLWRALREIPRAAAAFAGINASVVGLLAAVFIDPIATSLAHEPLGIALAVVSFAALAATRVPAWAVVLGCAAAGAAIDLSARR